MNFPIWRRWSAAPAATSMKPLVAEFDRCWPGVARTREVLVLAEEFGAV